MDFVDPILSFAEKLYALCGEVKTNKRRCKRLATRVEALVELVKEVKGQGLAYQPQSVVRGLRELRLTLETAYNVVKKYTSIHCFRRIVKAYDLGEEFETLNERLNDAAQLLSLALQAEHRQKLDAVFQEATRVKEDRIDRDTDHKELEKLLLSMAEETKESVDTVHQIVESTSKDVSDIKAMLKCMKEPSIQCMDIREIKPEELIYEMPKVPVMQCATSELYKGEYNKFTVAIKRFTCPTKPNEIRTIFKKEVETMRRFESPNILRMFGICVQDDEPCPNYFIVTEYCEKGSLRQVLDGPSKLSWERRARMSLDAAQGIYRLHQSEEKFKVHGCISSSKFLVDSGYRVKLGGFELAKTETSLRKANVKKTSSVPYCSPQQLKNLTYPYDKACEMYSFGIVLWEVATRKIPFAGCSNEDIYEKVYEEQYKELLPEDCPKNLRKIIDSTRSFEPFHRPSAGELVDSLRKVVQELEED